MPKPIPSNTMPWPENLIYDFKLPATTSAAEAEEFMNTLATSERNREFLRLRYVEGKQYSEIASAFGITSPAVRLAVNRLWDKFGGTAPAAPAPADASETPPPPDQAQEAAPVPEAEVQAPAPVSVEEVQVPAPVSEAEEQVPAPVSEADAQDEPISGTEDSPKSQPAGGKKTSRLVTSPAACQLFTPGLMLLAGLTLPHLIFPPRPIFPPLPSFPPHW